MPSHKNSHAHSQEWSGYLVYLIYGLFKRLIELDLAKGLTLEQS